jgi:hypothetical protein
LATYFEEKCYFAAKKVWQESKEPSWEEYLCIARLIIYDNLKLKDILEKYDSQAAKLDTYITKVLRQSETSPVAAVAPGKTQVNLSQWFQQIFEAEWHPLHALLDTNIGNLACNVRSYSDFREAPVKGAKLIDLGMEIGGKFVALLVALTQEADQKIGILVQVHPTRGDKYLPPNLRVVLSESGETLQTIQSRNRDYCIQLNRFQGLPGTSFTIQITLGKFSITQDFLI